MRNVYVVGVGITSFSRLEFPISEIAAYPAMMALQDAGNPKIDHLYVSNMGGGRVNGQTALASAVVDTLSLTPIGAETIENGPASGSSAIKTGFMAVASGLCDTVMVAGAERMREVNNLEATDFVATLTHPLAEYIYGVTLPSLAGMFTRLYMEKYGVTSRHLAMVAVKNHANAMLNPFAHLHQPITIEGILDSPEALTNNPIVADPLRFFDMCPVSDGGACVILACEEVARKVKRPLVRLAGVGQATDTHCVHERENPTDLLAVRGAAAQAMKMAGIKPSDVSVAELHDAFTILEIAESEEVGFFKKGEGHLALERGETALGGKIPINPSGGLKGKGHPVGATGIGQAHEIVTQLRGEAKKRQVKNAKIGLTTNFGGFGNNVVSLVFKRED
ncbi:MAG TPA: acetyl-CoA acetyltransferase [Kiritimatiellia bacterium]|nr:acetyl-CoA acetyltransferase [Kiritimatiellia bacterium]HRZ13431.1 acetyl-CoA acetyltransferase [Kiritimatiellia bacterium]HSA18929.1 acetyl-CoA acetyltransferase [Kiritimatiellia bacterium]